MQRLVDNFTLACPHCSVALCLAVIGGRWKGIVIFHLLDGTKRFNELRRLIPGVSQRMMTAQLRELEQEGIVEREVFPVTPPHVEYSLTDFGRTLEPIIRQMEKWGNDYYSISKRVESKDV